MKNFCKGNNDQERLRLKQILVKIILIALATCDSLSMYLQRQNHAETQILESLNCYDYD